MIDRTDKIKQLLQNCCYDKRFVRFNKVLYGGGYSTAAILHLLTDEQEYNASGIFILH